MDLKDIKKILGIETLNEEQQKLVEEKILMLVDVKVKERVDEEVTKEKSRLASEYETKFDEYKTEITSKFSDFIDSILDEELEIPETVLEFARKGEMYADLIEDFRKRLAIDEGVLTDDVKALLKEAKDELVRQKDEINSLVGKNMELTKDAKEMAADLYLHKKCEGLTEDKRQKVFGIIGGTVDKKEIDKKFDFVLEHVIKEDSTEDAKIDADTETIANTTLCKECGESIVTEGENPAKTCPKCGASLVDMTDIGDAGDGTGNAVVDPETKLGEEKVENVVTENVDPWQEMKKRWVKILKENKI